MKKQLLAISAMLALGTAPVYAGPADIVSGQGCVGFDANGAPWYDPNAEFKIVFTNNPNGNANVKCTGHLPDAAPLPDRAMHWDFNNTGVPCLGGDEKWKAVTTPNGAFSFTCHLK